MHYLIVIILFSMNGGESVTSTTVQQEYATLSSCMEAKNRVTHAVAKGQVVLSTCTSYR